MKKRQPNPNRVATQLDATEAALRTALNNVAVGRRYAAEAYAREEAAEQRLHDVHTFLHLALDRTRRDHDLNDEQREIAARILRELADVLGYPMGEPSQFDIDMWLERSPQECYGGADAKALPQ